MTNSEIIAALNKEGASLLIGSKKWTIRRIPISPCKEACPIKTDVKAYLGLISAEKPDKAMEVIKKDNPLPGICGRVCTHPCEDKCTRVELDEPLAICALKRFIADCEIKHRSEKREKIRERCDLKKREEKIAIIGSGPAGLTCASDLARLGYAVTIFESLPVAGGMLTIGIPAYRLPREIIKTEIARIKGLGVKIKLNKRVTDINKLKKGYQAIFIAVGAHKGLKLGIPGEDEYEGGIDCITFLRAVNLGEKVKLGKKVIVIGGGNAAIDAARTALRLGADVHIVYRRTKKEMPANQWEIEEAEKEGVKIHYLASPVKILGKKGKVYGMECIRNELGAPDESGRRRPVPIPGSEFKIDVDTIIPAISQEPDLSWLPENHGLKISKWNSFVVDDNTLATDIPGIFAGGDCVTGPQIVIDAIAAGHKAARSIYQYLSGEKLTPKIEPNEFEVVSTTLETRRMTDIVAEPTQTTGGRVAIPKLPVENRKGFDEVELPLPTELALYEAKRCMRCGPCAECSECIKECDKRIMSLGIQGELAGMLIRVASPAVYGFGVGARTGDRTEGELLIEEKKVPVTLEPLTAFVNEELCRGCGECEKLCEYGAPKLLEKGNGIFVSLISTTACRGCGVCTGACPSSAIEMGHFTTKRIETFIQQVLQ